MVILYIVFRLHCWRMNSNEVSSFMMNLSPQWKYNYYYGMRYIYIFFLSELELWSCISPLGNNLSGQCSHIILNIIPFVSFLWNSALWMNLYLQMICLWYNSMLWVKSIANSYVSTNTTDGIKYLWHCVVNVFYKLYHLLSAQCQQMNASELYKFVARAYSCQIPWL